MDREDTKDATSSSKGNSTPATSSNSNLGQTSDSDSFNKIAPAVKSVPDDAKESNKDVLPREEMGEKISSAVVNNTCGSTTTKLPPTPLKTASSVGKERSDLGTADSAEASKIEAKILSKSNATTLPSLSADSKSEKNNGGTAPTEAATSQKASSTIRPVASNNNTTRSFCPSDGNIAADSSSKTNASLDSLAAATAAPAAAATAKPAPTITGPKTECPPDALPNNGKAAATTTKVEAATAAAVVAESLKLTIPSHSTTLPSADVSSTQQATGSTTSGANVNPTVAATVSGPASTPATATTATTSSSPTIVTPHPNPEEAVKVMVNNIISLLETRGPLTMAQLEYNLPVLIFGKNPMTGLDLGGSGCDSRSSTSSPVGKSADTAEGATATGDNLCDRETTSTTHGSVLTESSDPYSVPYRKLVAGNVVPDIVELLVALGIVQLEDLGGGTTTHGDEPKNDAKNEEKSKIQHIRQPRYAIAGGQPRQFVVTPSSVVSEISKAYHEIEASLKRQELLREALDPATSDKRAAQILARIAMQYPQAVADDPVYVTALRNMHVDVVSVLGKHGILEGSPSGAPNAAESLVANQAGEKAVLQKKVAGQHGRSTGAKRGRDNVGAGVQKKQRKSKKSTTTPSSIVVESDKEKSVKAAPSHHPRTKASTERPLNLSSVDSAQLNPSLPSASSSAFTPAENKETRLPAENKERLPAGPPPIG